jgi:hypothetical protein
VLLGTAGGIATVAFSVASGVSSSGSPRLLAVRNGLLDPDPAVITVAKVRSRSREREVEMVTILPAGADPHGLPICLLLHGRGGRGRNAAIGGLPDVLARSVATERVRPFGFVALDGGPNSYWHRHETDDPLAMLLDEVPVWLAERGLGGAGGRPFAVTGVSMGGFGALLYARRARERGVAPRAVATIAPALITSWPEMKKRKAFRDQATWNELDPLRNTKALTGVPLGLWCGYDDRFIEGARLLAKEVRPEVVSISPGGHNDTYYRGVVPEVIRFLDRHLT